MRAIFLVIVLCVYSFAHCIGQAIPSDRPDDISVGDSVPSAIAAKSQVTKRVIGFRCTIAANVTLWSPAIRAEGRINNYISVGGLVKAKFLYFRGAKVEPFVRWFPYGKAPKGFYAQLKGSIGVYKVHDPDHTDWADFDRSATQLPLVTFEAVGGGVSVGYQLMIGYERWRGKNALLEFFGGFQYIYYNAPLTSNFLVQKMAIMMPFEAGIRLGGAF